MKHYSFLMESIDNFNIKVIYGIAKLHNCALSEITFDLLDRGFQGLLQEGTHARRADSRDHAVAGLERPAELCVAGSGDKPGLLQKAASPAGLVQDPAKDEGLSRLQGLADIRHIKKSQPHLSGAV